MTLTVQLGVTWEGPHNNIRAYTLGHLKACISSAKDALCFRSVCFIRVSARVLVGLNFGLSATM